MDNFNKRMYMTVCINIKTIMLNSSLRFGLWSTLRTIKILFTYLLTYLLNFSGEGLGSTIPTVRGPLNFILALF